MLTDGDTAPDFSLPGTRPPGEQAGNETARTTSAARPVPFTLEGVPADGSLPLNFYLFDFHPSCTEHVCALHDLAWFDLEAGLSVYGVSTDRVFSHDAFATGEGLGFPLLSDSDGSVAEAYGVLYDEFRGHKRIAKRAVFLVDADRTVRYAWSSVEPGTQPDWDAVHDAVHAVV